MAKVTAGEGHPLHHPFPAQECPLASPGKCTMKATSALLPPGSVGQTLAWHRWQCLTAGGEGALFIYFMAPSQHQCLWYTCTAGAMVLKTGPLVSEFRRKQSSYLRNSEVSDVTEDMI